MEVRSESEQCANSVEPSTSMDVDKSSADNNQSQKNVKTTEPTMDCDSGTEEIGQEDAGDEVIVAASSRPAVPLTKDQREYFCQIILNCIARRKIAIPFTLLFDDFTSSIRRRFQLNLCRLHRSNKCNYGEIEHVAETCFCY